MKQAAKIRCDIDEETVSPLERAHLCCQRARELEEAGDFEAARQMLREWWPCATERPQTDELDSRTAAEVVLLRAGALAGWIGSGRQTRGAQAVAQDFIRESLCIFESVSGEPRAAEAESELAFSYWREGLFAKARLLLRQALTRLHREDRHLKAVVLLRSAMVELSAMRFTSALDILRNAATLFEASDSRGLEGKFHTNLGVVFKELSEGPNHEDFADRALVEYADAASYHFEPAGCTRLRAHTENNPGFLLFTLGRFDDAHEHLERARPSTLRRPR